MSSAKGPLLGVLLILCATSLLATHDGVSKYLTAIYPLFFVVWVRYAAQTVLMLAIFAPKMGKQLVQTRRPLLQFARGLCLLGISWLFIGGLRYIPLAEATSVMFLAPLIVTVLSVIFLKETITLGQWVAVAVGLMGVLLIVRPGGELFTPAILMPLGASFCFAIYQLLTRRVAATDHPVTSNFLAGLIGTLGLLFVLPFNAVLPHWLDLLWMVMLGALAMTGHILLTMGFKYGSAATLAPFTYAQIIFAALIGVVFFKHSPDLIAWLGVAIIILSGLAVAWLQHQAKDV